MHQLIYYKKAVSDLKKLEKKTAARIIKKLTFYATQKDPLVFASALIQFGKNKYRFRIGTYRVIFQKGSKGRIQILYILRIKHRKDIYFE